MMEKLVYIDSYEYDILFALFNKMPFMDVNIAHIINNYIYSTVVEKGNELSEDTKESYLTIIKYMSRLGEFHSVYKKWYIGIEKVNQILPTIFTKKYLIKEANYTMGKLDGEYKEYKFINSSSSTTKYPFTILKYHYNYKNGLKDGVCKYFSDHGIIQFERIYKNNKLNGLCKDYNLENNRSYPFEVPSQELQMYKESKYSFGELIEYKIYSGQLIYTCYPLEIKKILERYKRFYMQTVYEFYNYNIEYIGTNMEEENVLFEFRIIDPIIVFFVNSCTTDDSKFIKLDQSELHLIKSLTIIENGNCKTVYTRN
jgi:antitoxin component YwqK of YwqJK toxin-antitoxin module